MASSGTILHAKYLTVEGYHVAIVQVSRITQRKGLEEDLPQPLAGAEFGWAIDQRRLFIGNGALEEGAPVVGNTEILTEFSDILAVTSAYTYQGDAAGYTVQTGSTSGTPVTQSLQSRLDSYAVVTDFGARGDGVTDDTDAINRALNQLYCIQSNPQIRRSLFFPAGRYIVTDTILVPPYACLYGEGADSSIIDFVIQPWAANTAYAEGVLVSNAGNFYRSIATVPATGIVITNPSYWAVQSLPAYVARTTDSLQQTGANIGVGGATKPQNVEITGMAWQSAEYGAAGGHDIWLLEQVNQISFSDCNFTGPLVLADLTNDSEDMAAVRMTSTASRPVAQATFDRCRFQGVTYAINTDEYTQGVTISNGWLDTLYQGIVLGSVSPVNGGPTGFRIMHNSFDSVYAQGVVIDSCNLNATGYNTFYDVGNRFNGVTQPFFSIISINADTNISVGDMFQRNDAQAVGYPRIELYNATTTSIPLAIASTNGRQIQLGTYIRESGQQSAITDAASNQTLFTVDTATVVAEGGFKAFRMEYTIYRTTAATKAIRTGIMTVVAGDAGDSAGEGLVYTDDFTENEQTDVTLTASQTGGSDIVTVSYSAAATGFNGTIYYSLSHLA